MAGRGNRRAAPRLVFGATVRMDFRGANGAKTCANRENDRLVILSRCGRDDVWLKTFTISNQRTQPSMRNVLPLSPIALDEYEKLPADEKEHFSALFRHTFTRFCIRKLLAPKRNAGSIPVARSFSLAPVLFA
jgi:hypothetical protein